MKVVAGKTERDETKVVQVVGVVLSEAALGGSIGICGVFVYISKR